MSIYAWVWRIEMQLFIICLLKDLGAQIETCMTVQLWKSE